jgi:hypothetical protein
MSDIAGLRKRLEAASEPSRDLDRDLTAFFYPDEPLQWPDQYKAPPEHWKKRAVPPLTASLDASLALVEKVKPLHVFVIVYRAMEYLSANRNIDEPLGPQLARAVVVSLLAALEARDA